MPVALQRRARWSALWQIPAAAAGGLGLAVLLGVVALLIVGETAVEPAAGADTAGQALAWGLAPWIGLGVATTVGSVAGISVVALLVRDLLAGQQGSLRVAWVSTWQALAAVLGLVLVILTAFAVSVFALGPIALVFLARCGWLARDPQTRRRAVRGLWLAVPGAASLALLAALPVAWAALLAGRSWRGAVGSALRQPLRGRLAALGGLVVVMGAVTGLTWCNLQVVDHPGSTSGGVALLALNAIDLVLAGAALGLLGHRRGEAPTDLARLQRVRVERTVRRGFWKSGRLASVAAVVVVSLLAPLAPGALLATAQATERAGAPRAALSGGVIEVDTLADESEPAAGECVDDGEPCSLRAALGLAGGSGSPAQIVFAVDGGIELADTLDIPAGTSIDADGHDVTLDAHHGGRALHVVASAEGGEGGSAPVALKGFTVTGGRSDEGGAGLFSDSTQVRLREMTFEDNVSGAGRAVLPDGGAVAVPYASLYVDDSTFVDNEARSGAGGAVAALRVYWTNATSVRNTGGAGIAEGGAIFAPNGGQVHHATVIGGGGVAGSESGDLLTIANSAIATTSGNFACARLTGPSDPDASDLGNVDPEGTCLGATAPLAPIGSLADNGGPTMTVALLAGSAAIGAAATDWCTPADQRGAARDPSSCDAGAFQSTGDEAPAVEVVVEPLLDQQVGTPVELGARVTSDTVLPAGTVRFRFGADLVASGVAIVNGGARTRVDEGLPQGARDLTAEFVPDDGDPATVSDPLRVHVRAPVRTTLTVPPGAHRLHEPVAVTATVVGYADAPGIDVPSGTVHFSSGDQTHDADLVDGVALWFVDELPAGWVLVEYDGDDVHLTDAAELLVVTDTVETTTTATVRDTPVEFGAPVFVDAEVVDAVGPADGRARLVVDDRVVGSGALVDGHVALSVSGLASGSYTGHVVFDPSEGWATSASEDVDFAVVPAATTVTLEAPAQLRWSDPLTATAQVTGGGRAGASVRLLDGTTVLAAGVTDSDGVVSFDIRSYTGDAGSHELVAEVVASIRLETARSSGSTLTVAKVPSPFNVTVRPQGAGGARVGSPLEVIVGPEGGAMVGALTVRRVSDGLVLASGAIDRASSTLRFLPPQAGSFALEVVYTPDAEDPIGRNSLPRTVAADSGWIDGGKLPGPTMTWTDPATPGGTVLTVDFGHLVPAPDGLVILSSPDLGEVAQGRPVDGTAELSIGGELAGRTLRQLSIRYVGGSGSYGELTAPAPDVQIPSWSTTTVLEELPSSVGLGEELPLRARVSSDFGVPGGHVVFTVDGVDLPPVPIADGRAVTAYTSPVSRDLGITARYVRPDGTGRYAASASDVAVVTVSAIPEPAVTLTGPPADTRLHVGTAASFTARVSSGSQWIAAGTTVQVIDRQGHVVGWATWSDFGDRVATISVTPQHAGAQTFRAVFTYDGSRAGSSPPLALPVDAATPLLVEMRAPFGRVGEPLAVTVSLNRSAVAALGLDPRPLPVTLHDHSAQVGQPVTLEESNDFTATFTIVPWSRFAPLSLWALSDGDGHGLTRASTERTPIEVEVRGLLADLTYTAPQAPMFVGDVWRPQLSVRSSDGVHVPTGVAHIQLRDDAGLVVAGCRLELPDAACAITTSRLPAGRYLVRTSYEGDLAYQPVVQDRLGLMLSPVGAVMVLGFEPSETTWMVGQQVTATWRTTDSRYDGTEERAPGQVSLGYSVGDRSGPLCDARAEAGSCTFTVPDYPVPGTGAPRPIVVHYTYGPDSLTPPTSGTVVASDALHCLPVLARNGAFVRSGVTSPVVSGPAPCSSGGVDGFVEGSHVTVERSSTLPAHYVWSEWDLKAGVRYVTYPGPDSIRFQVVDRALVEPTAAWAPVCATVTLTDESGVRVHTKDFRDPGRLELMTPSNCAMDGRESNPENDARRFGVGRYIVGTDVQLEVVQPPSSGTVSSPTYTLLDVPGTLPADETHPGPHLLATEDVSVFARWRIDSVMCTRVRLYRGLGGRVDLSGSTAPTRFLHVPEDGSCTTQSGQPGLLAGTTAELTATPDAPSEPLSTGVGAPFVDRWWTAAELRSDTTGLAPRLSGEAGVSGPQTRTYTIPVTRDDTGISYGVSFARVDCVPVQVQVRYPLKYGLGTDTNPEQRYSNCSAVTASQDPVATVADGLPPTHTGSRYAGWRVGDSSWQHRVMTSTFWYVRGTRADVTLPYERLATKWGVYTDKENQKREATRLTLWEAADNADYRGTAELRSTVSWNKETSTVAITASRPTYLRATYLPEECGVPNVTVTPRRFSYRWDPKVSSGRCPDAQVDPTEKITYYAAAAPSPLRPVWTIDGSTARTYTGGRLDDGRVVRLSDTLTYEETVGPVGYQTHASVVRLTYCAPMDVAVAAVGVDGKPLSEAGKAQLAAVGWGEYDDPRAMLRDSSGCPAQLMALENSTPQVGLRPERGDHWEWVSTTLNGRSIDKTVNPTLSVGPGGVTTDQARFTVKPRCYQLSPGDRVVVDTPANCPGGEARSLYLANTPVELHFKAASDKDFESWSGVDGDDDEIAVVFMYEDRQPLAHWDNLSIWEQAGNFFSNVAQRTVALLATVAMGLAGKLLTIGTVAALALGGLADALNAVGLGGSFADGLDDAGDAIEAGVDLARATTSCITQWATGGASALVPTELGKANGALGGAAWASGKFEGGLERGKSLGSASKLITTGINVTNIFAAGPDAYVGDARDAWSSISIIGSCLQPAVNDFAAGGQS